MPFYSADRQALGRPSSNPKLLLAIVGAHIAALAVLMSAKMDFQSPTIEPPLAIDFIEPEAVPPEPVETPRQPAAQPDRPITAPQPYVAVASEPTVIPVLDPLPNLDPVVPNTGSSTGSSTGTARPIAATPAVLLTGQAELKPPYPASKLVSGEEADLKLRLTIDERGRVTAVEPLGRADSAFVTAARRHIIRYWRYRPAMTDGRGVATTLVISLRFRLND